MCEAIRLHVQASSVHMRPQHMSLITASRQEIALIIVLDSDMSFSSISEDLFHQLQLKIVPYVPILLLIGDH